MSFNPLDSLPRGFTIELSVRLIDEGTGEVVKEGLVSLDKGGISRPSFRDIGLAVQAGSYQGLLAVWPKQGLKENSDAA